MGGPPSGIVIKFTRSALLLGGLALTGLDPRRGPADHSSGHAVAASHIQNRGRLAQLLAQGPSSSSKKKKKKKKARGSLTTDVSSGPISLTKINRQIDRW